MGVRAAEALAYADEVWDSYLADLAELVAVPSVVDASDAREGAPWGRACREALDRALDAAECIISRGVTEAQNRFN